MSNEQRHRYGETNPRLFAVDSARVIDIGDMCFMEVDDLRDAQDLTYLYTSLRCSQMQFAAQFVGVALKATVVDETDPVRVATSGVFEFACASATFEVDDLVGADDDATPELTPQNVIAVLDPTLAIGKVVERVSSAATKVMVEIMPGFALENLRSRNTFGGVALVGKTLSESRLLVPSYVLPANSFAIRVYGIVQEVFAGTTEDQGVFTFYDGDDVSLGTVTPQDAGADAVTDIVQGSVFDEATGVATVQIAAGKSVYVKVTQATENGDAAGIMRCFADVVPAVA